MGYDFVVCNFVLLYWCFNVYFLLDFLFTVSLFSLCVTCYFVGFGWVFVALGCRLWLLTFWFDLMVGCFALWVCVWLFALIAYVLMLFLLFVVLFGVVACFAIYSCLWFIWACWFCVGFVCVLYVSFVSLLFYFWIWWWLTIT